MTLKQLRAFLAVAQTLSFAQACEQLHLSQSALSLTIKALEDQLGGRLFSRTTRSVSLTPEGEALLPLARRLLAEWSRTEHELRQRFALQQGHVSVAAMPSFAGNLLPPVLRVFREAHPGIRIRVHDVINEEVLDQVRARQVEVGIAFEPPPGSPLQFTPLYVDRFHAVLPADSALAMQADTDWATLLQYPFIALQAPSAVRVMLEERLAAHGMALPVEIESHQLATVGRMVACGLGVSAVPALCVRQMHELGARCVALRAPVIQRPVGILTRRDGELSTAAVAFCDTLQQAVTGFDLPR
ncbi:LysR family transcriptional regulator [Isoalcanivorax pacificus]|nr:LysR family transcriptional regulator [Isoalcanivorax pacificus]